MANRVDISIVIPVLEEAAVIQEAAAKLLQLARHQNHAVEFIFVDGDPQGGTIRLIDDKRIITAVGEKGRGRQMNLGASLACGEILLFLHADTILPGQALFLVADVMKDKGCAAGAFDIGFDTNRKIFRITEHYVKLRTRLTRVPFGDQAIFIRREYFNRIGGFADIPLMEDVELMKRIRKRGDRIRIIPEKVITSVRRWEEEGIFYGTVRNWALQLSFTAGVPAERLAKWYRRQVKVDR